MINELFVGDSNTDYALFMDDDMVDEVYLGDTKIYSKPANIYGWHVDPTISDPSDAVTYIRDARGKNTAKMVSTNTGYQFDYGDWEDVFFMPKPCMLKSNGIVDYYLDPNDYSKKLEDGTISDIANADYDGNAMMEWPLIYYKFEGLEDKGYKAVEYIKSNGTQIITTDISIDSFDMKIDVDIQFGSALSYSGITDGNRVICGTANPLFTAYAKLTSMEFYLGYNWTSSLSSSTYMISNPSYSSRNHLILKRGASSWGSSTILANAPITYTIPGLYDLSFFGFKTSSGTLGIYKVYEASIYEIKIYDANNNLMHRLIPVERQSDNELGLYDTLTDKFYTNSGTGTFIKGNYITTGDGWFYCADRKVNNSYKCWSNYNSMNEIGQHFYTAIYNGTIIDGIMRSLSGLELGSNGGTNQTGETERTAALANNINSGTDVYPEWYMSVWSDYTLISGLIILLGKSLDVQHIFGLGITKNDVSGNGSDTYVTGTANTGGLFTGSITDSTIPVKIFGIENWWGCNWHRTIGLGTSNIYAYKLTYGTIDGTSMDGYAPNSGGNLGGYIPILSNGNTISANTASGYIKTMFFGKHGFIPIDYSGTKDTYWSCFGGVANNATTAVGGDNNPPLNNNAGLGISTNNVFTAHYTHIGTSLSCKPYFIGLPKITTPNVRISKEKVVDFITNNSATVEAQLYVQDVIDLPEYNTLANRTLLAGSTAIVISTHEIYMLDNNNEWILQGSAI